MSSKGAGDATEPHGHFVVFEAVFEGADVPNAFRCYGPWLFLGFGEGEKGVAEREEFVGFGRGYGVVFYKQEAPLFAGLGDFFGNPELGGGIIDLRDVDYGERCVI